MSPNPLYSSRFPGTMRATGTVEEGGMTIDRDVLIKIFSYYRDAEIRGASLLMRMMARVKDPEAQVLFSRHIDDETRHAWLWTKRIKDEGGLPVEVPDGYQRRLGKALGLPTSIVDLFALTVIVEERAQLRYAEHAASELCDEKTHTVLAEVTRDEKWHIAWMEDYLVALAAERGDEQRARETLARYRTLEHEVFEEMKDLERSWLGFSLSDEAKAGRNVA
jgi:rubrerythrin